MKQRITDRICSYTPLFVLMTLAGALPAQTANVVTGQYNNSRTAANINETILTPSNVSPATFGLLFTHTVDANFYAQPLYVQGLTINSALHNGVFVATMNDTVYAFDADTAQPALWQGSLGTPGEGAAGGEVGSLCPPPPRTP